MLAHYFYTPHLEKDLLLIVEAHQQAFEAFLEDHFDDAELAIHEKNLDALAAVIIQPISSELAFDDFYYNEVNQHEQRKFFNGCLSSICLENMPFLDSNPFQVSYIQHLLSLFDELLVDRGGVNELTFKQQYLEEVNKFSNLESIFLRKSLPKEASKRFIEINPMDFIVKDIYQQFQHIKTAQKMSEAIDNVNNSNEKVKAIFNVMLDEKLAADEILAQSKLHPKDFGDNLEKLKFLLKKITL
jgi:hypothetical protein